MLEAEHFPDAGPAEGLDPGAAHLGWILKTAMMCEVGRLARAQEFAPASHDRHVFESRAAAAWKLGLGRWLRRGQ